VNPAPSQSDVLSLAERALAHAGPRAQATAAWERRLRTMPGPQRDDALTVEIVCVDRGVGRVTTDVIDDAGLRAAGEAARELAAQGAEPAIADLPKSVPGRRHDGWDPAVLSLDPVEIARELRTRFGHDRRIDWHAGASRTAVVSTAGVRAEEQRTFVSLRIALERDGRTLVDEAAATGPGRLDMDALLERITRLSLDGSPSDAPGGELPLVLGPVAVAVVLDRVRPHFGALAASGASLVADKLGRRIVASCVALSESPRFPGTLPRSHDAEGLARSPMPLIQDGVAHRVVRDSASPGGASTGHATVALASAPVAQHLVLVGGGAADEDELMRPVERGLYLPALDHAGRRALGAVLIEGGRPAAPLRDFDVEVDALAVLAGAQALTMRQQLVPTDDVSARTIGASVCPALRASRGIRARG
jgi:predicted Zn-dependent protease